MTDLLKSTTQCEVCGGKDPVTFSAFELESYDITFEEKKKFHEVCFPCFHKLSEVPLQTEEVLKRLEVNKKHLEEKIKDGLVCPSCKTIIFDENHVCPL
jgi:ribosomal protein L34E